MAIISPTMQATTMAMMATMDEVGIPRADDESGGGGGGGGGGWTDDEGGGGGGGSDDEDEAGV
jgi:hypothetical protein